MKYVLITGGTSGIGFAMAGEFLERGYAQRSVITMLINVPNTM